MPNLLDQLGMGPSRTVTRQGTGYLVTVKPPAYMGLPAVQVTLTREQFKGYCTWLAGQPIQHALPSLSPDKREMLMTGMTPEAWEDLDEKDE